MTVTAAGLHPIVKALANGSHYGSTGVFPFVPGVDGVGGLGDGRRVFFGACAKSVWDVCGADGGGGGDVPGGAGWGEDADAAGMANPAMSSWAALTVRAKFVAGESVLILGLRGWRVRWRCRLRSGWVRGG